jgi:hypothetical protein
VDGLLAVIPYQVVLEKRGCKKKACEEDVPAKLPALVAALLEVPALPSLRW